MSDWQRVCGLDEVLPESGVAALIEGRQIALFRVRDAVYAIGNYDPASDCHVLSRGMVGDVNDEIVVASPIYKHHFSLISGRCLEDELFSVPAYLARVIEGCIWVRTVPLARRAASRRRLVVVGNGMAAMRTLEELLERAPQTYDITVFGEESHGGYNRVLLSPLLAGDRPLADILTHPASWFSERGIAFHSGDAVVHIDRTRRQVRSRKGVEVAYDRLVLATGSLPTIVDVPGSHLDGVISFRTLVDVDLMLAVTHRPCRAVIIGGGLLGLEAASGLARRGLDVTVVHVHPHLMERQLDPHASTLLRTELERRGLKFVMAARTARFMGDDRINAVQLEDGRILAAELVVMAVGVKPNVALARSCGLPCDRGVLVDDTLLTNDPAIYAVGECVQYRGRTFGLVAPLFEQARLCAAFLAGRAVSGYRPTHSATELKVAGVAVFSAGDFAAGRGREALVVRDPTRGVYKRLVLEGDRICGAVLYGDTSHSRYYLDLINQGVNVAAIRDELLFGPPDTEHLSSTAK
jgi:nitrite reductase (NADH) large subunit